MLFRSSAIYDKSCELASRRLNLGSVALSMDRLEDQSLLETKPPEGLLNPSPRYTVTERGKHALATEPATVQAAERVRDFA